MKLMIRNLPPDATQEEVAELCAHYGTVQEVALMGQDLDTQHYWGLVDFSLRSEALRAAEYLHNTLLRNHKLFAYAFLFFN
jgi:RNA recognition motif-containing protein